MHAVVTGALFKTLAANAPVKAAFDLVKIFKSKSLPVLKQATAFSYQVAAKWDMAAVQLAISTLKSLR